MLIRFKDGIGSVNLRYISEEPDRHGNIRLYFRKRGSPRLRLRAEIGTDAFMSEYKAALTGLRSVVTPALAVARGTLRWLWIEYQASPEFGRLDHATQTMRRGQMDAILPKWGTGKISELSTKYVRRIREDKAGTAQNPTPHAADNLLKTLRALFKWAVRTEHMLVNPARDVEKINAASDGHHTWTVDEIHAFLKRHPWETKAGLALALLLFFGVRRSDVVKLGRQMESQDGASLRFTEVKGARRKVKVHDLPILSALRRVLSLHPGETTYLLTDPGRPFASGNAFGNKFKDWCYQANLPHCSAHGLRKAGATIAADNGATEHQLMALYGWETPAQAAHYTKKANRKRMAADAARHMESDQKLNVGVSPIEKHATIADK